MGLKEIVGIRQYTTFTPAGKVQKMYEVTFTTNETEGEFTLDIPVNEFTTERARSMAEARAKAIDAAVG